MKTSYQVGMVGDISTASQQMSCYITVHDSMHLLCYVVSEDCWYFRSYMFRC